MAAVRFRELSVSDTDALGGILGTTWHADAPAAARALYGAVDFAQYARRHTFSQVAVMDGKPVGVVMARAGEADAATCSQWDAVARRARRHLEELGENLDEFDAFFRAMDDVDARLLAESGCDPRFELVLFAVGPETRGHGVGTKLLAAAQGYLRDSGAATAFLFTDTDCTWEYYEHRGMRRAAEHVSASNGLLPAGMFVYEMRL